MLWCRYRVASAEWQLGCERAAAECQVRCHPRSGQSWTRKSAKDFLTLAKFDDQYLLFAAFGCWTLVHVGPGSTYLMSPWCVRRTQNCHIRTYPTNHGQTAPNLPFRWLDNKNASSRKVRERELKWYDHVAVKFYQGKFGSTFFWFSVLYFSVSCDIVNEKFGKFLKWFAGKFKREWIKHQEEGDLLAQQPNTEIWHFLIFLIWHFLMSECKRLVLKPFFLLLSREHVCCVLVWMIAALLVLLLHLLLLKFSICWGFLLVF